jgi:gliding motility-associated-like protein
MRTFILFLLGFLPLLAISQIRIGNCGKWKYIKLSAKDTISQTCPGDGKNDFFVISNLTKYPNATLKIFNRWGNLVYIKDRYDNSWNGFSNSDKVRLGEELPNGTYFYVFEPNNGEESKQGFVILRR